MIAGTRDYERFRVPESNPHFAEQKLQPIFNESMVEAVITDRKKVKPLPDPPRPSDKAVKYLNSQGVDLSGLGTIYESAHWVNSTMEERVRDRLVNIRPLVEQLASKISELDDGAGNYHDNDSGITIHYYALPHHDVLFLDSLEIEEAGIRRSSEQTGDLSDIAEVQKYAAKAYPAVIVAEEQFWLDLEKDKEGNLALSKEEIEIFDGVRKMNQSFPLFINGRAGSGKSTLLQYIFAHQLMGYLRIEDPDFPGPVYFTCNEDLLKKARNTVHKLLTCNPEFTEAEATAVEMIRSRKSEIDQNFRSFHRYLLSLVPKEDISRFQRDRKVTFAKFTAMWNEKFKTQRKAREQFGPDVSWHVIRTFIKGLSIENFTDSEGYTHIDRKKRVVTTEAYERVFRSVWSKWYQELSEDGWWDDQDLARYLLENNLIPAKFPGIFCDEAQDFTRLELEIILRLNLFSERTIYPQEIGQIPFVFAGDPFQTLNPTGFRWESTKAAFVEKFVHALDPTGRSGLNDIHYHELAYNYRSGQEIVKFSNTIQAARATLFDIPNLKPQLTWSEINKHATVCSFSADDEDFWQAFQESQDIVLILPCAEGNEVEFCNKHPELQKHVVIDNGIAERALSSAAAKGQEWSKVAVFGFARSAPEDLFEPLAKGQSHAENPDQALPCEYFVNKLYVAVSRPRNHLYVVDLPHDFEDWWNRLTIEVPESGKKVLDREIWENQTGSLIRGTKSDLEQATGSDPLELARCFEELALADQSPDMMKQACAQYRNAGKDKLSARCKAMAYRFEGNYLTAGKTFRDIEDPKEALNDFWLAGAKGRKNILNLDQVQNDLRYRTCKALANPEPEILIGVLEGIADDVNQDEDSSREFETSAWHQAMSDLFETLTSLNYSGFQNRATNVTESLTKTGIPLPQLAVGKIYFGAEKFDQALLAWEKCDQNQLPQDDFRKAQIETMPIPERLIPLAEDGRHSEVLEIWEQFKGKSVPEKVSAAVANSMLEGGNLEEAFSLANDSGQTNIFKSLSKMAYDKGEFELAIKSLLNFFVEKADQDDWTTIYHFLINTKTELSGIAQLPEEAVTEIRNFIISVIARSETFTELDRQGQQGIGLKEYASFLNGAFVRKSPIPFGQLLKPLELGAALERSGNRNIMQSYYEKLQDTPGLLEPRELGKRLIVCLERKADFYKSRGDKQNEGRFGKRARDKREEFVIKQDLQLEQYPVLSSIDDYLEESLSVLIAMVVPTQQESPATRTSSSQISKTESEPSFEKAEPLNFSLDLIDVVFREENGKLSLSHEESGKSIDFSVHEAKYATLDLEVEEHNDYTYHLPAWSLWVELPIDGKKNLIIRRADRRAKITIAV